MTTDTTTQRYNGWTNYETWNLALWIGNDEGSDSYWREAAQECYDDAEPDGTFTRKEQAALALADRLKDETEENAPEVSGFYADVLSAALGEVNYHEIAEHWLDDVEEEDDEPSDDDA